MCVVVWLGLVTSGGGGGGRRRLVCTGIVLLFFTLVGISFYEGCVLYMCIVHCYHYVCIYYVNTFGLVCGSYGYIANTLP